MTAPSLASRVLAVAVLCLATVATAAQAEPIVVRHAQGEITLPDRPKTVLVFDLATLDTLDALGIEVAGVPGSNIPDYLAKYRGEDYIKIGSLFEPDYETVHAARPDLIVIGGRSAARYGELSRIAPTIDLTVPPEDFLDGARRNIELIGAIFGKEREAAAKLGEIDAALEALRERAGDAGRVLILMTNGGKITAYGRGSRFGWVHEIGFEPAVDDVTAATHGEAISFEFLHQTDPDWLIVIDRDAAVGRAGDAARRTLDNELVAATSAARNGRILYVDTARWYLVGGGLDALRFMIDELAAALDREG